MPAFGCGQDANTLSFPQNSGASGPLGSVMFCRTCSLASTDGSLLQHGNRIRKLVRPQDISP